MSKTYYKTQFDKLHGKIKIKFVSDKGETNYINMNHEFCQFMAIYLTQLYNKKQIDLNTE